MATYETKQWVAQKSFESHMLPNPILMLPVCASRGLGGERGWMDIAFNKKSYLQFWQYYLHTRYSSTNKNI
jgi:hypothetical protein